MAIKTFSIIKKEDLLTGRESIARYALSPANKEEKEKLLKKLKRMERVDKGRYSFSFDEVLSLHILEGISKQTVQELSKHIYPTCYAVVRKTKEGEKALYLSILKDTASRYLISLPKAVKVEKGREVLSDNYFIKEIKILV